MRRAFSLPVAAVVVAATLGVVPAHADVAPPWPLNCGYGSPTIPTPGTVYVDSTGAHVNLEAVGGDTEAVSQWAVDYALHWARCISSRVPTEHAMCVAGVAANITAYFDVSGSQISVYYPALVRDLGGCGLT